MPRFTVTVTEQGISEVRVPAGSLSEQHRSRELLDKCAPVIATLDEIAKAASLQKRP